MRRGGRWLATVRHRFRASFIETEWRLTTRRRRRRRATATVHFPTTGPNARVFAVFPDGAEVALTGTGAAKQIAVDRVDHFRLESAHAGYVVVPRYAPRRAVARIVKPKRQSSAPRPGPTLAIDIARSTTAVKLRLRVRLATCDGTAADGRRVAAQDRPPRLRISAEVAGTDLARGS